MFLNPLMLAGLGGALLPVVLHLLSRSRFRTVDWAAMMFLEGQEPRQRQSTRLKQLLLLLVRMALVALLAVALARPIVSDSFAAVASGGHVSAVIVVDSSLSTNVIENGKPRSELIQQAAIQIISSLQKGDEAAVVLAGGAPRSAPRLGSDLSRAADEIAALQPAGRANLAEALSRASELLNRPQDLNRRLFVVSDRQAVSWSEVDAAFRTAWRTRAQREPIITPLVIIPVGQASGDNLAVQSAAVLNPPIVRDQPIDLEVKIRNYGKVRRSGVPVAVSVGYKEVARTMVDCPPDSTVSARFTTRIVDSGPQVLSARLQPAAGQAVGLTSDDSLDLAIDISEPTRVLLLSGDERSPRQQAESYFATLALQPFSAAGARSNNDPCRVTIVPADTVKPSDLLGAQVVILANAAAVSPVIAGALEQFVYGGGGLLVAPGQLSRAASFNSLLYREGTGILPAGLIAPDAQQPPAALGAMDLAHSVTQFLRGRAEVPPATIGQWFKLSPIRGETRTIASLSTGEPWAIECTAGRGRVILLATPIDADWSTLPLTSFYLPFMQSAVRWLAGGGVDRNLAPGSPLVHTWTGETRSVVLTTPDGRSIPLEPQRLGDQNEIRFTSTDQPGQYRLKLTGSPREQTIPFIVQPSRDESDLTPMTETDWKKLERDLDATVVRTAQQSADVLTRARQGREIWAMLILAVMGLGLLESWLAGRWSRPD